MHVKRMDITVYDCHDITKAYKAAYDEDFDLIGPLLDSYRASGNESLAIIDVPDMLYMLEEYDPDGDNFEYSLERKLKRMLDDGMLEPEFGIYVWW